MVAFVDSFQSPVVNVHFDTGNIMQYQFPENWVPLLGKRIKNIHFKEWDKRTHEFNLHTFRPLLDGTTNWPAVMEALDKIGYRGYLTFEYFHPFMHYPEALVYQTSDALIACWGRKHRAFRTTDLASRCYTRLFPTPAGLVPLVKEMERLIVAVDNNDHVLVTWVKEILSAMWADRGSVSVSFTIRTSRMGRLLLW